MVVYIILALNPEYVDEDRRLLWVLPVTLAGVVAWPIFCYLNVWQEIGASEEA